MSGTTARRNSIPTPELVATKRSLAWSRWSGRSKRAAREAEKNDIGVASTGGLSVPTIRLRESIRWKGKTEYYNPTFHLTLCRTQTVRGILVCLRFFSTARPSLRAFLDIVEASFFTIWRPCAGKRELYLTDIHMSALVCVKSSSKSKSTWFLFHMSLLLPRCSPAADIDATFSTCSSWQVNALHTSECLQSMRKLWIIHY